MNNSKIQQKLKIMSMPGSVQLMVELLIMHDQVHNCSHDIEYYMLLINEYKASLKRELKVEDVVSKQSNLETLIMDLASGKEPKWIRK